MVPYGTLWYLTVPYGTLRYGFRPKVNPNVFESTHSCVFAKAHQFHLVNPKPSFSQPMTVFLQGHTLHKEMLTFSFVSGVPWHARVTKQRIMFCKPCVQESEGSCDDQDRKKVNTA